MSEVGRNKNVLTLAGDSVVSVASIMTVPKVSRVSVIDVPSSVKKIRTTEELFSEIGYGRSQLEILFVVVLVLITSINENIGTSFILPAAQCDLDMSTQDKGLLSGMISFGMMLAICFWGFIADTRGRRFVILLSLSISTSSTIVSVFVNNFEIFVFCKFLTGIFVAGYIASSYAYVGEFNTQKNRATIISWLGTAVGIAAIIQPLLAWWILSYDFSYELYEGYFFRPWRLLILVFIVPGVVSIFWLFFRLKESPKFYMAQNEKEKALDVLKWMHRTNKGAELELAVDEILTEREPEKLNCKGIKSMWKLLTMQTVPLFKPPNLIYLCICSFICFGSFSVSFGLSLFQPEALNKMSQTSGSHVDPMVICDAFQSDAKMAKNETAICNDSINVDVFIESTYVGAAFLIGFVLISLSIQPFGRRKLFVVTLVCSCVSGIFITLTTSRVLILSFYCLSVVLAGINVAIINSAVCDLFPTHLRAMAVCITMLCGRLGNVVSANFIGAMIETHCVMTFNLYAGLIFVCLIASLKLPDTKKH